MARLKPSSKKLSTTQTKVTKQWQTYKKIKTKVIARKDLSKTEKKQILQSELDLTRQKISDIFIQNKERQHSLKYKSEFPDFKFTNHLKTVNTRQEIYKAKRGFDTDKLDTIIEDKLSDPKVQGILVVFEVENDQGIKSFVSNYITSGLLERIQEINEDYGEGAIFDFVTERLNAGYKESLKLKFIYMRIIYAKS